MTPRVSVVIRTFNRAEYLRAAIESVFAQTFRDFELIVVDDGSTDDTPQLLADYGDQLTPIFLSHTGNPATTFNTAVRATRGEFIAILDDDDLWLSHKLEAQVGLLDRSHRAGFAYGNARLLYPDGSTSPPALAPDQIVNGSVLRTMIRNICVHPSTLLFRRECLARVELPDERQPVAETFLFSLNLARAAEVVCVREPITLIRQHASQLNTARGLSNYQAAIAALEILLQDHTLPLSAQVEAHRSLARFHTHLAKNFVQLGRVGEARRHALRALARYPLHRPAWRWALQSTLKSSIK